MPAPMRFERDAPIGRHAAEQARRAERVGAQSVLLAETKRLVAGQLEIKQVVDKRVSTDAADMRGKGALDYRRWLLRAHNRRHGIGECPGRCRVPHVLNGWIVVRGDAVDEIKGPDARGSGKTNVGIVPGPGVSERIAEPSGRYGVVGDLREGADIVGNRSTPERTERRKH